MPRDNQSVTKVFSVDVDCSVFRWFDMGKLSRYSSIELTVMYE